MDSIKPEKDEVDLHRNKKKRPPPTNDSAVSPVAYANGTTVRLSRPAQWALFIIFLLVFGLAGMGYWQVKQQQNTIQALDSQLEEASRYISQSKLIIARLEGQITQTDATMAQSGNELARELKFLDSEVRKLWDVANKRNKQSIQNNQNSLKRMTTDIAAANATADELLGNVNKLEQEIRNMSALSEAVATVQAELKKQGEMIAIQQAKLAEQNDLLSKQVVSVSQTQDQAMATIEELQRSKTDLSANQQALSDQLVTSLAEFDSKIASQRQTIQTLVKAVGRTRTDSVLSDRLKAVEASMAGLDKVRGQLVQRIVSLDARINEIQLEMQALQSRVQVSKSN